MSKFSKILVVLLSVCLLFGAITTTLTSATETHPLQVTADAVYDECTSSVTGATTYDMLTKHATGFGYSNPAKGPYLIMTHVTQPNGNTYARLHYDASLENRESLANCNRQAEFLWQAKSGYNAEYDLSKYAYMTFDFDFCADKYVYAYDGGKAFKTAVDDAEFEAYIDALEGVDADTKAAYIAEGLASRDLAILCDTTKDKYHNFFPQFWNGKKTAAASSRVHIYKNADGVWCAGLGSNFKNAKANAVPLINEVGVFEHFTYVVKKASDTLFETHLYVNGEYAGRGADLNFTSPNRSFMQMVFAPTMQNAAAGQRLSEKMYDRYSMAYDNVAVNYYTAEEASKGLDAHVTLAGEATDSLMNVDGVLFSTSYPSPNGYVTVDGKITSPKELIPEALAAVKNDSVLKANIDVTDFDIPDGVERFTLYYNPECTEFTLSEEDAKNFFILGNNDGSYTVRVATEADKLKIKRIVKYGEQELVVNLEEFVFLLSPEANFTFTSFNFNDLKVYEGICTAWTFDVDGNVPDTINLYNEEALRALTELEAALIKEEFDGILTVAATAVEGSLTVTDLSGCKYIAGYENNGVFTPILDAKGGYENYKDLATLESEKASWDEDVVYYLIEDGKAVVPGGSGAAEANANWNASAQLNGATGEAGTAGVTDLVKNTFKDNGTVDGYGILIIR